MSLEKEVSIINKKVSQLLKETKEEKITWVKASVITSLTGWNYEGMRRAREYGYVKYRKDETGFWYNLESVNPLMFKTRKTA